VDFADSAKNAQNCQRYVNSAKIGLTKQGYNSTTAGIFSNYTLLPQRVTKTVIGDYLPTGDRQ
jgi:hypothetical protein